MKILYTACLRDPRDHDSGSGIDYELYHTLLAKGADVNLVGPFIDTPSLPERIFWKVVRMATGKRAPKYSNTFLKMTGRAVERAVEQYQPEIIFSLFSAPLVHVKSKKPIVYVLDSTLRGSQEEWAIFSSLAYRWMLSWEEKFVRKCARILAFSQWTADILAHDYKVDPRLITVIPIPASLPIEVIPTEISPQDRALNPLHLLLVGKEYQRKGVDIAIQVTEMLNEQGIPCELRVVGQNGQDREHVQFKGLFMKKIPEQLKAYTDQYRWADFLIHPARFEAAGIVPGEAAAFGVPTITNASAGLPTTVKDHVSGIVLTKDSPAEAYVQVIKHYLQNRDEYLALCKSTKKRYHDELNWPAAGDTLMSVLQDVIASHDQPAL